MCPVLRVPPVVPCPPCFAVGFVPWGFPLVACVGGLRGFVFLSFCGVFTMSSLPSLSSLSPLGSVAWGGAVVVSRLGWCASSRSVLVWVHGPGFSSPEPLRCRVGSSPSSAVSALVASLRAARDSSCPVVLGVRSGWSGSRWFCAVAPASGAACRSADAVFAGVRGVSEPVFEALRSNTRELARCGAL